MKKLMFMIAAVAMAASLQAASMQWGIDKTAFKLSDGNSLPNGVTVYLLNADASDYATFTAGLADGSITSANVASKAASYTGLLMDTKATKSSANTTSTGMGKNYAYIAPQTISVDDLDAHYYTVLTFDPTASDGSYLLSGKVAAKGYEGSDSSGGQSASFGSSDFSSWSTPASPTPGGIPEPTSGLLLVLGGAMLALRRRRA